MQPLMPEPAIDSGIGAINEVVNPVVGNLDFFIKNVDAFFHLEHAFNEVVVLVNFLFELFYAVVAQFGIERDTAERAAQ